MFLSSHAVVFDSGVHVHGAMGASARVFVDVARDAHYTYGLKNVAIIY